MYCRKWLCNTSWEMLCKVTDWMWLSPDSINWVPSPEVGEIVDSNTLPPPCLNLHVWTHRQTDIQQGDCTKRARIEQARAARLEMNTN